MEGVVTLWLLAKVILSIGALVFFGYPFYVLWYRITKGKFPPRKGHNHTYIE